MTAPNRLRRRWLRVALLASPLVALLLLAAWLRGEVERATSAFTGESLDEWARHFPPHEPDERACAIAEHAERLLLQGVRREQLRAMSAEERAKDSVQAGIATQRLLASARRATDDANRGALDATVMSSNGGRTPCAASSSKPR